MVLDGAHHTDIQRMDLEKPSHQDLLRIFTDVRERIKKSSEKNKKAYDLRRRPEKFVVGQQVWKRNYVLSNATKFFSAKLAPKFTGPFTIVRAVSPWTYSLCDGSGRSAGIWHAKDLKPHR